jgi:hypothetical protein
VDWRHVVVPQSTAIPQESSLSGEPLSATKTDDHFWPSVVSPSMCVALRHPAPTMSGYEAEPAEAEESEGSGFGNFGSFEPDVVQRVVI